MRFIPSPLNWTADWISRRDKETQLALIEAYICLYVAVFVTIVTVGVGIELRPILF